jgi:hypothetical protein
MLILLKNPLMQNLYSCWSGFDFKRSFIQTQKRNLDVLSTLMDLVDGQKIADAEGISLKLILIGAEALKKRLKERCLFAHRIYSSRRKLAL